MKITSNHPRVVFVNSWAIVAASAISWFCLTATSFGEVEIVGDFEVTTDGWLISPDSAGTDVLAQESVNGITNGAFALRIDRTGGGFWAIRKEFTDTAVIGNFLNATRIEMDLTFNRDLFIPGPNNEGWANVEFALNAEWNGWSYHQRKPDADNMNSGDPGASINLADTNQPQVVTHTIAFDLTSDAQGWLTYMNGLRTFNETTPVTYFQMLLAVNMNSAYTNGSWILDKIRFEYTAAPPAQPGDFDGDGDVDGADFVVWQTNFPKATGGTLDTGDADADGDVDGADFVVWQTNFPFTPSPGVAAVPEPGSAVLLIGLAFPAFVAVARRFRRA